MTEFDKTENECQNINALIAAVEQWYIHPPGHDVGTDLNKVAVAYVRLKAGTGQATELQDLPKIEPGMIPSPNAQPEAQEPDMESLDAMERAGRLAMVEDTRKAWSEKPPIDAGSGAAVSTSGWVQTISTPHPLIEESRVAFENRYHKIAAAVPRDDWDRAYAQLAMSGRESVTGKEIEDLALTFGTKAG